MTCVLWWNNRLYADSLFTKGDESFHSLTKIKKFNKPLKLYTKNVEVTDGYDYIYGYVITGPDEIGTAITNRLFEASNNENIDSLNHIARLLENISLIKMNNFQNSFTMLLIGNKKNYMFSIHCDSTISTDFLNILDHTNTICFGIGAKDLMDVFDLGYDPVKCFYHTFYKLPDFCGGMIDVWKLDTDKPVNQFTREGVYESLDYIAEISAILINPFTPLPYDLVETDPANPVYPEYTLEDRRFPKPKEEVKEE